ncbi:MAG: LysM peptidoglycan-binding domain-containing protein [Candidatus Microsaccharimonas sossegonensis]|uniref:LysM peptidoglycan-binding domain-containing protein n=1 Tax=Candidatus Microsaccharimonas sossegonensis TaxID=2506948 RepID=A0A4Q0AGB0_9BACT|nr:MAG: LysM peptidoglycan-binding domain-containing protein [Candidatus Microsaccharimonas sossegonensis]
MSLPKRSHGYRYLRNNTNDIGRHVPLSCVEVRLSKVVALVVIRCGRRTTIRNHITGNTADGSVVATSPQPLVRKRFIKDKSRIKSSSVAVYASVFALLVVLIAIGYRAPQQVSGLANTAPIATTTTTPTDAPATVNDVVASNIAANVANTTNLSVAPSVVSMAISTQIQSALPSSDGSAISKPQIIQVASASRQITSYTVAAGDTTDSIAAKYGISKQTLKWANNLSTDTLIVGSSLTILPRDGIAYTVKTGDTLQIIADKYKSDVSLITTYNDLEISGITPGMKIIIPNGVLPNNEQPGYVAPVRYTANTSVTGTTGATGSMSAGIGGGAYVNTRPPSPGNKYAWGNCTWYVYERRLALGMPVGSFWGNGGSWAISGRAAGYVVDNTPAFGAVLVQAGNPGHNAVVESVAADGTVVISEMNNWAYGGFNIINTRTISAGQASLYQYVH